MARFSNWLVCPLVLINITGVFMIFFFEIESVDVRKLSEDYLYNLRGSKYKTIKYKEVKVIHQNLSYPYNQVDNEFFVPKRISKLRKLTSNKLLSLTFCSNIICAVCCIMLMFSFCVEEHGSCECCDCINYDTDYYYDDNKYYNQGVQEVHYHYHYHYPIHRPRPLRMTHYFNNNGHSSNKKSGNGDKKDEDNGAAALVLILLIIIIAAIVIIGLFLIPRAFGKTGTRYFTLTILCICYGIMTLTYSLNISKNINEDKSFIPLIISSILLGFNLISMFIPCLISKCRRRNYNPNTGSVDAPLNSEQL